MTHQAGPTNLVQKPQTVAHLAERIRQARATLEQLIGPLSDEALTRPGPEEGWSIKDHLAHLAAWPQKLLAIVRGRPAYEGLQVDEATYGTTGMDGLNAILYERHKDRPLADVLADFRQSYQELLSVLAGLTDADLSRPYHPADPNDTRQLVDGIIDNSYGHDLEHIDWMMPLIAPHTQGKRR